MTRESVTEVYYPFPGGDNFLNDLWVFNCTAGRWHEIEPGVSTWPRGKKGAELALIGMFRDNDTLRSSTDVNVREDASPCGRSRN